MGFWIGLGVVAVLVLGLAWWYDRRSRRRLGPFSADHEIARGMGTIQGMTHSRDDLTS